MILLSLFSCVEQPIKEREVSITKEVVKPISTTSIKEDTLQYTVKEEPTPKIDESEPIPKEPSRSGVRPGKYVVIAKSGLFLRAGPNTNSEIIHKVPYFEKVEVVDEISYGRDSIKVKSFYHYEREIKSSWVKVNYNKQEGYMLSLYLSPVYRRVADVLDQDHALQLVGGNCDFNFHPNPNLQWYGIFKEAGSYLRKPISLEYQYQHGNGMDPVITDIKNGDSLVFCFASDRVLPTNDVKNKELKFNQENRSKVFSFLGIGEERKEDKEGVDYFLTKNGITQKLNLDESELEWDYLNNFMWIGDLDEDGEEDYLIRYNEKVSRVILYLSAEAKEGELVRPVAIYLTSNCC